MKRQLATSRPFFCIKHAFLLRQRVMLPQRLYTPFPVNQNLRDMDLLVKDTQICVEAFLQNTLFMPAPICRRG